MRVLRVFSFICLMSAATNASAACTAIGTIEKLWPREGGWVHISMEGRENMDLMNCGTGNKLGLLLNLNDTGGSLEGKKMLYSTLLAAFVSGKKLRLCSLECDSQYPWYSKLSHIDELH